MDFVCNFVTYPFPRDKIRDFFLYFQILSKEFSSIFEDSSGDFLSTIERQLAKQKSYFQWDSRKD